MIRAILIAAAVLSISSCSLFCPKEPVPPKDQRMLDAESKLLEAAQDRAIRKILGLPVPDGSIVVPSK